jgi:uncharacterized protein (UPF0261 family)
VTPTVVLLGTLDTKGEEHAYLRRRLEAADVATLLVDVGTGAPPTVEPDISRTEVAAAAGVALPSAATAAAGGDRGQAVATMAAAAATLVTRLHDEGRCQGILGAGGSGNTAIATAAMRALPIGVPKLMVSTVAGGDTRAYVGTSDLLLMAAVTDVSGINVISARILANAAAAMAGMVGAAPLEPTSGRPLLGATMFGVTTPCVTVARRELEQRGYEVIVFSGSGSGGRTLERLLGSGFLAGVLDATTTELADELVGGILSAGPERLEAAGRAGVPQVVSLGALDMVNFGAPASVPERFRGRTLHAHDRQVTLLRTTAAECADLGRTIARKLSAATGPTALFVPLGGVSAMDAPGAPFFDPEADAALFEALRRHLAPTVELHELPLHINEPAFALAMATRLDELLRR